MPKFSQFLRHQQQQHTHTHTHRHKNTLTEHVYKKVSHFGNKINFKKLLVSLFFGFFLIIFFWGGLQQPSFSKKKNLSLVIQNVIK